MKPKSIAAFCFLLVTITSVCTAFAQEQPAESPIVTWKDGDPNCDMFAIEGRRFRTISHSGLHIAFEFFEARRANAFRSLIAGLATTRTTTTLNADGSVSAIGAGGVATGRYSESGSLTTTAPDMEARERAARQNAEATAEAQEKAASVMSATLKANTLFPKQDAFGEIYFEKKKFTTGFFAIQLGETIYRFRVRSAQK